MQKSCFLFLQQLQKALQKKYLPQNNAAINYFMQYSGSNWNDQGDVDACLRQPTMNFVEVVAGQVVKLFRGLCLPSACDAQFLNDNKDFIFTKSQTFHLPQGIKPSDIEFQQYPSAPFDYSQASFIIMTCFFSLFIFCFIGAYVISKTKNRATSQLTKSQVSNTTSVASVIVQRNQIERPLIDKSGPTERTETATDLEALRDLKQFEKKKPFIIKVIECWNLKDNLDKILTLNVSNKQLMAFNCLRVISFCQVILGHGFFVNTQYFSNFQDFQIIQSQPFLLFVFGCLYSVDVFFFLGGFFVAYVSADPKFMTFFSLKKPVKAFMAYFMAIVNRLFRISPSYYIVLFIVWKYTDFLASSPTWPQYEIFSSDCDSIWWQKVLYIDNFTTDSTKCFVWSWYLACDIQMFVGSLLLIIIYANHRIVGKISIILACIISVIFGILLADKHNYHITISQLTVPTANYYTKPYFRCPPYLVGLYLGILYKEFTSLKGDDKQSKTGFAKIQKLVQNNQYIKWVMYILGLGIISVLIFGPRQLQVHGKNYWNKHVQHIWYGVCRPLYVIGVTLIILPGMCGSNDLIMRVMSSKVFQLLAKLTYQGYLVHFVILTYTLWSFKDPIYLNNENIISLYIVQLPIVLFISFLFVLFFEQPFTNLANILFASRKQAQRTQRPEQEKIKSKQIN
ncbi:acyltransferase family protein (macronuclear) [Tetrahymena thermophila SB210]|uniref:Acyltransferase family protein n=1 Tax=Tetrahymena thermophila (strain SB210) TaxID=312017 RepID=Q237I8_TETTS|nr:acyltransferase family protein [Tetrahymena thermophila SB210]EAR92753.1 acyltransferase family protein [Tetrahymena thermophila SB210]|eukprot:XP_001012998.1 acyltransferase family protein [Tetrahymena thermophila SB210]